MSIGWKYLEYPIFYIMLYKYIFMVYQICTIIRPRLFWGEFHPSYLLGIGIIKYLVHKQFWSDFDVFQIHSNTLTVFSFLPSYEFLPCFCFPFYFHAFENRTGTWKDKFNIKKKLRGAGVNTSKQWYVPAISCKINYHTTGLITHHLCV